MNLRPAIPHLANSSHAQTAAAEAIVLCAAIELGEVAVAPEAVHLLPAGEILTLDGRGPYRAADMAALIAGSLTPGDRLVIDQDHATDLAAPKGLPAPARAWITALEARSDGLWGTVEWTVEGRALVESRAYRSISPVIEHDAKGNIVAIRRASLVNRANLRGLKTLHQETSNMDFIAKLAKKFGLADGAAEDAVLAAIDGLQPATALQAQLAPIAKAAGLAETATAEAVLGAVTNLAGAGDAAAITALQAELATLGTELKTERETRLRDAATAFVDQAILDKRPGIKPMRDRYIAMHMADPVGTVELIGAMPKLGPSGARIDPPAARDGEVVLNAEQERTIQLMGIDRQLYIDTLKREQAAAETAL